MPTPTLQPEDTPTQTPVPTPTLQPAVDTPSQPNTITYIIRSGDSLRQIAEAHNTSIDEILKLNPENHQPQSGFTLGVRFCYPAKGRGRWFPPPAHPFPRLRPPAHLRPRHRRRHSPPAIPTGTCWRSFRLGTVPTTAPTTGDEWDHWVDDDRDCENARAEVLIAESRRSVTYRANGCTVDTGLWVGPWGGRTFTQASQVDIDHHVPLYNAHISGGHAWSRNQKTGLRQRPGPGIGTAGHGEWGQPSQGCRCARRVEASGAGFVVSICPGLGRSQAQVQPAGDPGGEIRPVVHAGYLYRPTLRACSPTGGAGPTYTDPSGPAHTGPASPTHTGPSGPTYTGPSA